MPGAGAGADANAGARSRLDSNPEPDALLAICSMAWHLSSVSALYNLQYSAARLKQYAAQVKRVLSTLEGTKPVKYRVDFIADPNLKKDEDDPHALVIEVYIKTLSESGREKLAYTAILASWGHYSEVPNATHLPFLLEHGQQRVGAVTKCMLTKLFDCSIVPVTFTPIVPMSDRQGVELPGVFPETYNLGVFKRKINKLDTDELVNLSADMALRRANHLLQFLITYSQSESLSVDGTKVVELHYRLETDPSKHKISIKFEINDILRTWDRVCAELEQETTIQHAVDLTYRVLQQQLYHSIKMDTSMLQLTEISHPKGNVKCTGVVRLKSPDVVRSTFPVLNDFVTITMH